MPKAGQTLGLDGMQAFSRNIASRSSTGPNAPGGPQALAATASGKIQRLALRRMLREEMGLA
jgi:cyclohexanecarboxylate-CoA ligase